MPDEDTLDYFVVTVRETVSHSYPVRAAGSEQAKAKVSRLLAEGCLRKPSQFRRPRGDGEAGDMAVVGSAEAAALAAGRDMTEDELGLLLAPSEARVSDPTPQTLARTAREVLAKNGSGSLRPSRRKRT